MQDIIAFENEKIYCCKKYYEELESLCRTSENSFFNCLKKEDNHIQCLKYAGYFQLSDGRGVWILPKIILEEEDKSIAETGIQIFLNLVETALSINNVKTGNETLTNLDKEKVFIVILVKLFCFHMDNLFKKGIKKHYSLAEDNLTYLKGKINFSEHIKKNIVSKEKFYVEFDEFTEDIPENRILVSACKYLIKKINNLKEDKAKQLTESKKKLKRYIQEFGDIEESKNLIKDFAKLQKNRLYEHYDKPLLFAEVFLSDKNYWLNRGRKKFPAIMFSLHELFEDYIQNLLKRFVKDKFIPQYSPHFLITESIPKIPDIINTKMDFLIFNEDKKYIIFDAKYKLIDLSHGIKFYNNETKHNLTGIESKDLFQLFTYSEIIRKVKQAKSIEVALLYPKTDKFKQEHKYYYFNGLQITFIPIDLTGDNEEDKFNKNNILKDFIENTFTPPPCPKMTQTDSKLKL